MKLFVILALVGYVASRPQVSDDERYATTLQREDDRGPEPARFRYYYLTSNGIEEERIGTPGENEQSNMNGFFKYPTPDGDQFHLTYEADEYGYRPDSPFLPQAPPMPQHALEQIAWGEQQRAAGKVLNEFGLLV